MATITGIGSKNYPYFAPILPAEPMGSSVFRMGLIEKGLPVGAVELNKTDGMCEINSIYVVEEERRKGFGTELLRAAERLSKENSLLGIQADFSADEGLSAFFEKNNYFVVDGEEVYELPADAFFNSEVLLRYLKNKGGVSSLPYGMLTSAQNRKLKKLLIRGGFDENAAKEVFSDPALSQVSFDEEKNADGVLLISEDAERLMLSLLLTASQDNVREMQSLFTGFFNAFKEEKREDKTVSFYAEDKRVLTLMEKVVSDKKVIKDKVLTQIAIKAVGEMEDESVSKL